MDKNKKFLLQDSEIPKYWYNIQADMPNKCLPSLHPATHKPLKFEDLQPIFADELIKQEGTQERFIEIPEEVWNIYKTWRTTPLIRAYALEKLLDTPAKIYYKNEGVSPVGSHKANTSVPQAYYNKIQGVKRLTTETGAGQWGSALSYACNMFGLDLEIYMVKSSFNGKPYRKVLINSFGAKVYASPSDKTEAGRNVLEKYPDSPGSLGIAISEAIEKAVADNQTKYTLGSVLNHVLLHQTVIGLEAEKQMELAGDYPDVIIGCFGGGSNFAGISFPFIKNNLTQGKTSRFIAVEPASCPKLTKGEFRYDYGDLAGYTPLIPMYTLGHNFIPETMHAGGLRYHGAGPIVSQLLKDRIIEAEAIPQMECFEAGLKFIKTEGIFPAPESTHAIASAIRQAEKAKEEGISRTILFNLSGHGHFDMTAYEDYMNGKIQNHELSDNELYRNIKELDHFPKI